MTPQPLSEADFDSLSEALERLGGRAMNLEQLDGFLASLVCGPADRRPQRPSRNKYDPHRGERQQFERGLAFSWAK